MAKSKTASATKQSKNGTDKSPDAIRLLRADHREVKGWFKDYEKLEDDEAKQDLADQICIALTVHAQIEEEILYPAARDAVEDDDLLDEAEVEHSSAKQLIAEIEAMKAGEDLFDAKVKVLGEYVNHHIAEEESELFPEIRDSELDLKELGEQLEERKTELMEELRAA